MVLLIGPEGQQLGKKSLQEALKMSEEAGLDLVEVSPETTPPVCRILDFGKFKFQMSKRKSAAKKKQKQIQIKEIKCRPATDVADMMVKLKNIRKFLAEGDKVKVTVRFRGREMAHPELGMQLMQRIMKELVEDCVVEQHPKFEGKQILMIIGPKKK